MRDYSNNYDVKYDIKLKSGDLNQYNNGAVCFSRVQDFNWGDIDYIKIYNINCTETFEFRDRYLKYIGEMLRLECEIGKNSFKFKAVKNGTTNLAICAIVRILWEGTKENMDEFLEFFENLLIHGKINYRDKLKRFCYFYSLMDTHYLDTLHHISHPNDINIRSIKDFKRWGKGLIHKDINEFFKMT